MAKEISMRTILLTTATIVALSLALPASTGTWTGRISDSPCGASHAAMKKQHGGTLTDEDCTAACVKNGGKYVFVSGGRVYAISNQDQPDLARFAGKAVEIAGDMEGTTITVSKVSAAGKKTS
jgi:hypothetical protein